ncbi:RHD3/Sey1 [Carpediemonas membranifera]|uniref:RHD3/Sey1 n=1 Tax=Carpediemonas membranifera TaxID=201153 RepID=A0A8J6AS36_9EUKA|nr:RHD3/Sey1 [Carpediemonas membranifera]|eukprot:KAG9393001.1 RHD3/Sey1 [Carpediemonas membranifera]
MMDLERCQLVDGSGKVADLSDVLTEDMAANHGDFRSVAILGCQSSGKSTLMNHLFGTTFPMMDSTAGRQQTTHGIWLEQAKGRDILVIDCEGTDSRERGEEKDVIERKYSLFTVALSEVILLNMWAQDVGRYNAGNYPLLKTVFDVNLQLFGETKQRTKIIVVIRDYDGIANLEAMQDNLRADFLELWASFPKPEGLEGAEFDDYFLLDFKALSHFVFCPDKFKTDALALQEEFTGAVFEEVSHKLAGIPVDGLPAYFIELWTKIDANEDLNLPSTQQIIAVYRTEQVKARCYQEFRDAIADDSATVTQVKESNGEAGTWADVIRVVAHLKAAFIKAVAEFDEVASRYSRPCYQLKRRELIEQLSLTAATVTATATDVLGLLSTKQLDSMTQLLLADYRRSLHTRTAALVQQDTPAARLGITLDSSVLQVSEPFDRAWVRLVRATTPAAVPCTPSKLMPGGFTVLDAAARYLDQVIDRLFSVVVNELRSEMLDSNEVKAQCHVESLESYSVAISQMLDTVEERLRASGHTHVTQLGQIIVRRIGHAVSDRIDAEADGVLATLDDDMWTRLGDLRHRLLDDAKEVVEGVLQLDDYDFAIVVQNSDDAVKASAFRLTQSLVAKLKEIFATTFEFDRVGSEVRPHVWRPRDDIPGRYAAAKGLTTHLLEVASTVDIESSHGPVLVDLINEKQALTIRAEVNEASRTLFETALAKQQEAQRAIPPWMWVLVAVTARRDIMAILTSPLLLLLLLVAGAVFVAVVRPPAAMDAVGWARAKVLGKKQKVAEVTEKKET